MLRVRYLILGLLAVASVPAFGAAEKSQADAVVVIYNKAVPDSVALANFYAQQRSIPRDHLVGLACSSEEEISREEYDSTIAEPLREIFKERGWWTVHHLPDNKDALSSSTIHFAALIKGIPLKIRSTTATYVGDQWGPGPVATHNEACVDSELAALPYFTRQISGALPNPYF